MRKIILLNTCDKKVPFPLCSKQAPFKRENLDKLSTKILRFFAFVLKIKGYRTIPRSQLIKVISQ